MLIKFHLLDISIGSLAGLEKYFDSAKNFALCKVCICHIYMRVPQQQPPHFPHTCEGTVGCHLYIHMRTTLQNVSFISSFPGRWRRQRIYPYIHTSSFSPRAFCSFHMTTNTKLLHYKKHDQRERERSTFDKCTQLCDMEHSYCYLRS